MHSSCSRAPHSLQFVGVPLYERAYNTGLRCLVMPLLAEFVNRIVQQAQMLFMEAHRYEAHNRISIRAAVINIRLLLGGN